MEEYISPCPYFDNIRMVQHLARKQFVHKDLLEDHWITVVDDYDIHIRHYCRMTLYLVEKVLKIKIFLRDIEKDT